MSLPDEPEDRKLFLEAAEGAIPLKTGLRADTGKKPRIKKPAVEREEAKTDFLSDHVSFPDEESSFCRPGLSRNLKKLKRGGFPIEGELDLHGMTSSEARIALLAFLDACRGMRTVRIIHGKGQGILKSAVRNWLVQIPEVLAFSEAKPGDGGSGAVLVLLKTRAD